ncbi:Phosphotriesterase-like protein [Euroglyphus maynei]|uniref:Phosphotriesterase-related protein n=1 Tax=Euroglyphus maynei TaxID=6958 RepID=A0A1Y3BNK1_EURMA|nr:Phosphotriesterase-like protein [Euroglyphus maynei]
MDKSTYIQTVLGRIEPNQLGLTLCHEHLYHKAYTSYFVPKPLSNKYSYLNSKPVTNENLWYTVYHPHTHEDNLDWTSVDIQNAIEDELKFFKTNGGSSMVEVTTFGTDLPRLAEFSRKSGVNIIGSTGFYVHQAFTESVRSKSIGYLYETMKNEFISGVNGIRPGVIGELGSCWPIDPFEKNVLIAAAKLQNELRLPVIIHPGRHSEAPFEIIRIFSEAGGIVSKTVMSHLERTLNIEQLIEFAQTGVICEFDLFGAEISYYEAADNFDMPNDATRIRMIKKLIDEGYGDHITISHDIHTKHRLMKWSGHGYSHILLNVLPKMIRRGITNEQIEQIMIQTPCRWLTISD